MALSTTSNSATFNGNGTTGPFTFPFRFLDNSHISLIKTSGTVAVLLQEGLHYTLTGAQSYQGGSIMLASALVGGETLTITRTVPLTQPTSIRNQGAFYPEIHEEAFDRITMQLQQVANSQRTIHVSAATPDDDIGQDGDLWMQLIT